MKTHVLFQVVQSIAAAVTVVAFVGHQVAVHDHVAVQMANLLEALAADSASVRTFVHVRGQDVRLQICLSDKRGFTHVAFERSYVSVDRQMRLEYILVLEVLLAQMTLKRTLVVMHLLVHRQVRQLLEHLGADLALIRTAVLVRGADVTAQRVRQSVPFTANLAAIRPFVGVRQQVAVEIALLQETRATHVALVRLLAVVHVHVLLQRVGQTETLGAHGALEPTLARVHQHVRLDMPGLLEPFTAHLAVKLTLLRVREYVPLQYALRGKHFFAAVALEQTIDVAYLERRGVAVMRRVRMRVSFQRVQRVKFHGAHCALERTIIAMRERVLAKMAQLFEALVTYVAHIRPLVRMRPHVPF